MKSPAASTNSEQKTRVANRSSQRILLVDDEATARGSISDVLVSEGYVVIPANDGQQALQLAASIQIDLALLDLNMPVKNGWDTFEQLSRLHPTLPVIIVTARPNQLFTAVGAGVGALLEKPTDIPTLLRTIKRLLAESDQAYARFGKADRLRQDAVEQSRQFNAELEQRVSQRTTALASVSPRSSASFTGTAGKFGPKPG